MELSKYIKSESVELNRSAIHFADYNPRKLSDESRKTLKRGIKKFGLVGGIVVNKRTGLTVVSGHQRLSVMDELQKFPDNDYRIRVDVIDVDEQQEKELNILMNNPNAQGSWDFDALARIVPDIDWKDAGLTDADLNMIGVDFLLQTEEESSIADALSDMMVPVSEQKEADISFRQTIIEAGIEVNDALVAVKSAREKAENYSKQVKHLQDAVKSTQLLMKHGSTTYLEVLTAQQTLLEAQVNQVTNHLTEISNTITLYQALGGGR